MSDTFPYQQCPKCQAAPLPLDQSLPASCPSCGLILAKFATASLRADKELPAGERDASRTWAKRIVETILRVPPSIGRSELWARSALLLLIGAWGLRLIWLDHRSGEMGSTFLHGPLLIFHEAGHVIFSPLGEFITILGGTLAQLLMPAIMAGTLLIRSRDPCGAAIATWFLGVSLLDVAPYVYDALHPQLVLLNGSTGEAGGHDWIYLLGETGLLQQAHALGWLTHKCGAVLILLSIAWAARVLIKTPREEAAGYEP